MPTESKSIIGCTTIEAAIIDYWFLSADGHPAVSWGNYTLAKWCKNNAAADYCGDADVIVNMNDLSRWRLVDFMSDYRSQDLPQLLIDEISKLPLEHESLDVDYMREYTLKNLPDMVENADYGGQYFYKRTTVYESGIPQVQ